ncbi:unnamed protein product [Cyprideis torosa]|uniref:Uncharacterized protein n=1 Tax=Cyprideis torosa TaxID=163714 RepID=A0A7R8WZC9_9CRUS|nr:unnamed protein product [Cyprideis torosa]CAG0909924.1 unnamed protein product [Cyprideis torosa]
MEGNQFQLVSGERRFRASKLIGLKTIPAYVRIANDQEMLEMALVENIQRKDLDPIEVALSYRQLIEEVKLTQEQLSIRVGKNRSTVTNFLRLLKLDPIIQTGIRDGFLSMGHGRALINIPDTDLQLQVYQKIIKDKLSVRQTEQLVKNVKSGKPLNPAPPAKKEVPEFVKRGIKDMSNYLGHKIEDTDSDLIIESEQPIVEVEGLDPLSPARAAFYSAVLPGLGQAYNKKYWKIPIVYAAIGTGVYFVVDNQQEYLRYQDAYKLRISGRPDEFDGTGDNPNISEDGLIRAQEVLKRNRDLALFITIGLYALNIIEANVDAHLDDRAFSRNLSVRPTLELNPIDNRAIAGVNLKFDF